MRQSFILPLFLFLLATAVPERQGAARLPEKMIDVFGESVDVASLARKNRLVVITLKATWCEVCQQQLRRIKAKLKESRACGLTFLVLAPGPDKDLRKIREGLAFPFPFVEDKGLLIAESLGLRMGEEEILPTLFLVGADLGIDWIQAGRSEGGYGDEALFKATGCADWI
jgi:peroxiredoxin